MHAADDGNDRPSTLGDRYKVEEQLGQGGMARVYRAWDLRLNRPVAVKEMAFLPADVPRDTPAGRQEMPAQMPAQMRKQFRREAQTLARLQHPNLVQVTDFFAEGQKLYLVMAYVAGESLAERIRRLGPLPASDVLGLGQQLLDALAYIHNRGIIHRDIKPANIIVREDGAPVLVDFGLVKEWQAQQPETQTVVRGMGTPGYTPPEQYSGTRDHTDARSDIYSLGATLYHALAGEAPPSATDRLAQPELLRPLHNLRPDVPPVLGAAIQQAMALPLNQRFASVAAMRAALQGGSVPSPAAGKKRSRRLLLALSLLPLLLLLALWLWSRKEEAPLTAELGTRVTTVARLETPPTMSTAIVGADADDAATITATPTPSLTPAPSPTPSVQATTTPTPPDPEPGAEPVAVTTRVHDADGAVLVYIPAGAFLLGLTDSQVDRLMERCGGCERGAFTSSQPQRNITLDGFWIYQTEVTIEMYRQCVADGACAPPAEPGSNTRDDYWTNPVYADLPVINVTWSQADAYCRWAGGRLPTNAEWEKAARGTDGRLFPWGDDWPTPALANVNRPAGGDPVPVGSYPAGASPYGVYEMAGNVWEWVADWFDRAYYAYAPAENPPGPSSSPSGERVGRGGNWFWYEGYASAGYYDYWDPAEWAAGVGFRCAMGE